MPPKSSSTETPQRLRWLSEQFTPRRNARVLEVGCGSGHLLALLAHQRQDLTLVGIDRSGLQVRKARQRLAALSPPPAVLELAVEDAAERMADARFTHIVAMNVNLFWTDPRVAGPALRALLAPRGTVLLGFEPPTPDGRAALRRKLTEAAALAGFAEQHAAFDSRSSAFVVEWRPEQRTPRAP